MLKFSATVPNYFYRDCAKYGRFSHADVSNLLREPKRYKPRLTSNKIGGV